MVLAWPLPARSRDRRRVGEGNGGLASSSRVPISPKAIRGPGRSCATGRVFDDRVAIYEDPVVGAMLILLPAGRQLQATYPRHGERSGHGAGLRPAPVFPEVCASDKLVARWGSEGRSPYKGPPGPPLIQLSSRADCARQWATPACATGDDDCGGNLQFRCGISPAAGLNGKPLIHDACRSPANMHLNYSQLYRASALRLARAPGRQVWCTAARPVAPVPRPAAARGRAPARGKRGHDPGGPCPPHPPSRRSTPFRAGTSRPRRALQTPGTPQAAYVSCFEGPCRGALTSCSRCWQVALHRGRRAAAQERARARALGLFAAKA